MGAGHCCVRIKLIRSEAHHNESFFRDTELVKVIVNMPEDILGFLIKKDRIILECFSVQCYK